MHCMIKSTYLIKSTYDFPLLMFIMHMRPDLTKPILFPENTPMHIMVSISCSVGGIQIP